MFRFLDGPAGGVTLNLSRAPAFLRVVVDRGGNWDALDSLLDQPKGDETIFVYRLVSESVSSGIACSRGPGGGCRPFVSADYKFHSQPDDAEIRETGRWRAWSKTEYERENNEQDQ